MGNQEATRALESAWPPQRSGHLPLMPGMPCPLPVSGSRITAVGFSDLADRAGLQFEAGLPERILQDTGDEPGALALVAYTLDELYQAGKESRRLTHAAYEALGGVRGAIGRRAVSVFAQLPIDAQSALPRIFQKLVAVDHRGVATRERAELEQVSESEASRGLIDAFTSARLLVQSRGERGAVVEVAHEALFRDWQRLAEWIDQTRHDLYLLGQMRRAAALWKERGRSRDFLWLGERGAELQQVLERLKPQLSPAEKAFARPEQEHLIDELDSSVSHARRSEIGLRLHVIGDTRPGVGLRSDGLPNLVWLRVPRGEAPVEGRVYAVQPFHIAKYPITHIQFQAFLDDREGFDNGRWWDDLPSLFQKQKTREQLHKFTNHPRDNVSWYQAVAYTRWLTARLPEDGFPENVVALGADSDRRWVIRLPTEWEWQHAATTGDPSRVYPWGQEWQDGYGNTHEAGLYRTMAVGMYPTGASPVGALDMGSNVREWCLNEYSSLDHTAAGSTRARALRGASFARVKDFSRCIARHCDDPDEQPTDDSFRVVFAPEL